MRSKKTVAFTLAIAVAFWLGTTLAAQAGSRYAAGFRGVAWGTSKAQLPELGLSAKALKNIYAKGPSAVFFMQGKGSLKMDLDGVPLLSIFMRFHNQRFCGVDLIFDPQYKDRIQRLMAGEIGAAGSAVAQGHLWRAGPVTIVLTDREVLISHATYEAAKGQPDDGLPGGQSDPACCRAGT